MKCQNCHGENAIRVRLTDIDLQRVITPSTKCHIYCRDCGTLSGEKRLKNEK